MSEFKELCLRRQTCREFAGKPVEHEKLVSLVDAARLAPSGGKAHRWSFIVAESQDMVRLVADCVTQMGMNPFAAAVKAFVVVMEEPAVPHPPIGSLLDGQFFAKGDSSAATAYLCLEAEAQGLGACQFAVFDQVKLRAVLDIPQDGTIAALVGVGYPLNPGSHKQKPRRSLEEIARFV